jgi:hypothetical protein
MKINEFIQKYRNTVQLMPGMTSTHIPHVVCKDGFKMSVQAGQSLYSEPRDVADSYEEAEVGFPSILHPTQKMKKIFVVLFMDMYHVQLLMK